VDLNKFLVWSSGVLALALYIPLLTGILHGEIKQSFATWILWVVLDGIAMVSIILQDGNWLLLACYVSGGTIITISLVYTKQFKWTWFEWCTLGAVIFCLIVAKLSGARWATITSTLAVFFSGFPQFKDSWKEPHTKTALIYLGYVVANSLSFFGGKSWSIEERFYPGMMTLLCLTIMTAAFRKQPQEKP